LWQHEGEYAMRKRSVVRLIIFLLSVSPAIAFCDPMDDLLGQFEQEYQAAEPRSQYSSVKSDYKIGQTALGAFYTTKMLSLLYKQNEEALAKYNEMIEKYDQIVEQNRQIIRILSLMVEQKEGDGEGAISLDKRIR
jgi:hypothetical protein